MRNIIQRMLVAILTLCGINATAQTNIQEMYDINREHLTTTIEGFYSDKWGSTYFFTDIYHPTKKGSVKPNGYYTEIARSLNFWKKSALAPLSLHVEWNGGQHANNAWLFGVEYFLHNADFRNTFTLELMYKRISQAKGNTPFVLNLKQITNSKAK